MDEAIRNRGYIYLKFQLYNEALTDFNQAIELNKKEGWYLYCRALAYQKLNQADKAQTDIYNAMKLAKESYDKDSKHWRNTFNLALYSLGAGKIQQAQKLYQYGLANHAPLEMIQMAMRDLNHFLLIIPGHVQAEAMRQLLQSTR